MLKIFRFQEYSVLFYRLFLAYFFYFLARVFFVVFNYDLLDQMSLLEFVALQYHGLVFDTTAILYVNLLFILISTLPLFVNTKPRFEKVIFYIYFFCNLLAYATNFIDFIYFKFILSRSTLSSLESIQNEGNKFLLLLSFLKNYWYVFVLFFVLSWLWVFLYKLINVKRKRVWNNYSYVTFSMIFFVLFGVLIVGGIRSDFRYSTRPINLVDASRFVQKNIHANVVLNTPFAIIRTINKKSIKRLEYFEDEQEVISLVKPIKQYSGSEKSKPNVVIFILESVGSEYLGAFNPDTKIKDFQSYSPFIDSLAAHSLIFTKAYSNGHKSIHGMSSVLAGIPSFKDAYTSTAFSNQEVQSLVSVLEGEGYNTSFFHGAQNGSMGFLGFSNVLGIDKYYGKSEFNNDDEFDGVWGIWDEPFLQFMKEKLDSEKQPFMSTVFTVTSHEPYAIPEKYEGKFPKGKIPMHQCIAYTDYALKQFFEKAKKEPWFENTIFVMVADHTNHVYYPEYRKPLNLYNVPILFYSPNEKYTGVHNEVAQQIDIYPTILDMIGYDKPFRSWGRSLISSKEKPFVIRHMGSLYYYFFENYVCLYDGEKVHGLYATNDIGLTKDLKSEKPKVTADLEKRCKAFLQDYMNRIIDYKLNDNTLN